MNSINKLRKLILVVAGSLQERDVPFNIKPTELVCRIKSSIQGLSTHLFYPPFPESENLRSFRGRSVGDDIEKRCGLSRRYPSSTLWMTDARLAATAFMPSLGGLIHEEAECFVVVTYAFLAAAIADIFVGKYFGHAAVCCDDEYALTMADTECDGVKWRPFFLELDCTTRYLAIVRC